MLSVAKKILLLVMVLLVASSATLFAQSIGEPVVLRLTAYIPPQTTFVFIEQELTIDTNVHNFTYSLEFYEGIKLLSVVAR